MVQRLIKAPGISGAEGLFGYNFASTHVRFPAVGQSRVSCRDKLFALPPPLASGDEEGRGCREGWFSLWVRVVVASWRLPQDLMALTSGCPHGRGGRVGCLVWLQSLAGRPRGGRGRAFWSAVKPMHVIRWDRGMPVETPVPRRPCRSFWILLRRRTVAHFIGGAHLWCAPVSLKGALVQGCRDMKTFLHVAWG